MKNIKKILFILALMCFPNIVFAYTINRCDTYVNVTKDKITYRDTITASFDKPNTKIEKNIDKKSKNINVSSSYNNEDSKIIIDSNNYDNHKYTIRNEIDNKNNEIYKIKISNDYNANINIFNYDIDLPFETKEENIKFYLNGNELKDIKFEVEKNKITGSYTTLKENDELIVEVRKNDILLSETLTKLSIIGPIIFVMISYVLWLIFGKDRGIKIEKTSIVPKKENPLELALMYNGKCTTKDIVYMILELANKGYIKIIEKNKNFTFIRTKQYNGSNYKESVLFKSIFRKNISGGLSEYINMLTNKNDNKRIEYLNEISLNDLRNRMRYITNEVLLLSNSDEEKNKYFEKEAESKKVILSTMIALILVLVTSIPFIELNMINLIPISVMFSIVTLLELINISERVVVTNLKYEKKMLPIIGLVIIWGILITIILKMKKVYILSYIIGIISSLSILVLYKYMPKRTIYATREMGKVEGFKQFINTCKDEELKRVLETNENYYYDALPYTFITSCNNKLTTKAKKQNIKQPEWYEFDGEFTIQKFNNSIGRLISSIINDEEK